MDLYDEVVAALLFVFITTIILCILRKAVAVRKRKAVNETSSKSGHYWTPIEGKDKAFYCAHCKEHIISGYECDNCLLKVDQIKCLRDVSSKIQCKVNQNHCTIKDFDHHWTCGNLGADQFCELCDELCGGGVVLQDYRCSWCFRVLHKRCKAKFNSPCDFGPMKHSVIPPYSVTTRRPGNRNQRMAVIEQISAPNNVQDWRPLMVLVNSKSGSGAGKDSLRRFRSHLHPGQVVNILKSNIGASLKWIDEHEEIDARVLIAGGDGTICSALDQIDALSRRVPTAVLPLGTGNDLSRCLRWGSKCDGDIDVAKIVKEIEEAEIEEIDRWTIYIENARKLGVRFRANRTISMTNYVSIGVDACVTLGMQTTRDSIPKAMSSRLLNKFLFFTFGTKDVFERVCKGLNDRLELYLDDVLIKLPNIEGLIFLNIPYWGAGVKPWSAFNEQLEQKCDDGLFEVFAVTSSFHIAQMQVGMADPICIGQARKAKLVLKGNIPFPMQADGEAWKQSTSVVQISHKSKTLMLRKCEKEPANGSGRFY